MIKSKRFQVYWFTCCLGPFDTLLKRKTVSGADLKFHVNLNLKTSSEKAVFSITKGYMN